jgi:hypothetical protein
MNVPSPFKVLHRSSGPAGALRRAPIYKLAKPNSASRLMQAALIWLGPSAPRETRLEDRRILASGTRVIEVVEASGAIWASDAAPDLGFGDLESLPTEREARERAEVMLAYGCLIPENADPVQLRHAATAPIRLQQFFDDSLGDDQGLAMLVSYAADVCFLGSDGQPIRVPVVGGGAELQILLGKNRRIVGFSGAWRELEVHSFESNLISREEADELFLKLTSSLDIHAFDSTFCYYAAPAEQVQTFLYPVYVYRAYADFEGHQVPVHEIPLPATRFGPPLPPSTSLL